MKWKNIVIAGDVGSGTTTLARNLAKQLNWQFISAGSYFRDYAAENKIPLWNKEAIPDDFEKKVDYELLDKIKNESGLVVEGHYTGWFVRDLPNVYRILLTCNRSVATKRMLPRRHSHPENAEDIEKRREGLYAKFKKLYSDDDYEDPRLFHIILDTTNSTPQETLEKVLISLT